MLKWNQIQNGTPCYREYLWHGVTKRSCWQSRFSEKICSANGLTSLLILWKYGFVNSSETWPHGTYWKGAPFCRPLPIIIISLNSKKYFSKLHISYWQKQKSWYNKCIRLSERYVCKEIKCRTRIFLWCPTEYLIWSWSRESLRCTAVCFVTVMRVWPVIRHAV